MRYVGTDAKPIRRQIVITYPSLQITCELGLSCGKPIEVTGIHQRLRANEVVIGAESHRGAEDHIDLHLLPADGTLAARELIGNCINSIHHAVGGEEIGIKESHRVAQRSSQAMRVAEPISTSAGEFFRVGTRPSKGPESFENRW